ncbi:phospholipid-transporting ATPase ABCA1-like [Plodia interpunctella]|uniref:phospholipid-transporting ATPase ABCA1-like n=1 Tax=Plodia interpunctella TaxID=58824 RepID=UPI0023682AA1|nr:phospholipid-transporting ATPase ABCA1-like [Plodia interpunctella]
MPSPSRSNFLISPQPPKPPSKMGRTLFVLLWKHFTVRCRQYINTPLELLLPVLFFILLFVTKGLFTNPNIGDSDTSQYVMRSEPNEISRLTKPDIVIYFPQNNVTDQLMDKVGESLRLKRLVYFDGNRKGYFGTNDIDTISLKEKYRFLLAFVSFQNMDYKLPDNLNYTIRMKKDFETQLFQSMDDEIGPHMNFGMNYAEFVRLQWTIDTSYLELRTGIPVKQNASIQEFPYVRSSGASYISILVGVLSVGTYFSLAIVFVFIMIRMVEERASGIQELIKMVGVTNKTLGLSHLINLLPGCLLFAAAGGIFLVAGTPPLLESTNGFLVSVVLFLHYMSIVAWAFIASYTTINSQHTTGLAIFIYVVSMIPANQLSYRKLPAKLLPLAGLLPGVPATWFFKELSVLEQFGAGLTFKTMMSSHSAQSFSVAVVYMFLLMQLFLYFMIAWYLSLVRPGKYGTALPWDFLFRKEYWSKNEVHPDFDINEAHEREKIAAEQKYFEPLPANSDVGIEIDNVSKSFEKVRALNQVSLPVLKGEITVLLGHNGAGKTTLMSIITGMMTASSGKVYVNGLDTVTQQTAVRSQLGFCPQHNLFFKDLTVLEHVKFFCLLKGALSWEQSTKASMDLLSQLGLEQKANSLSGQLSGGMKRRLQLACALAGDASVLVLDEPTAGLDVETRRSLWDLLLSLRTGRTVLISTHFMEEADALGDRVAALHRGILRCYATPMHLKKEVDTGYRLSITLEPNASPSAALDIKNAITSALPQATQLPESGVRTLAFSLPSRESAQFPRLFTKLEKGKDKLGIESIGVCVSTLEEVFLKLCSDVSTVNPDDEVDATLQDDIVTQRMGGVRLILSQMVALFVRQIRYSRSSWKMFLLTQVILPIVMLCMVTKLVNDTEFQTKERNSPAAMNMDLYQDMDERKLLSSFDIPLKDRPACCGLRYDHADNISETLIDIAKDDKIQYNKYLIGVQLNESNAVAYYTTTVRHALPIAMNALTNAIASTLSTDNDISITTINHPIDDTSFRQQVKLVQPKSQINTIMWAFCIGFFVQTSLLQVLVLPCKERISRTRHIHIMSGCSPELHWMTSLLYHAALSMFVLIMPTIIFALAVDNNHTLSQADIIFPLSLLLVGGCLAFIALAFLVSFLMNSDKAAATALFGFTFLFSLITPAMKSACQFDTNSCAYYGDVLDFFSYTITPQTLVEAMLRLSTVARLNAYCNLNRDQCPNLLINDAGFDAERCCANLNPRPYLAYDDYSPLIYIVALYTQFLIIMNVVFLTERGLLERVRTRTLSLRYAAQARARCHKDDVLEKEHQYVDEALARPRGDALLISSVHKHYPKMLCGRGVTAVRGVSFAVREGECFGLVGVNGAGKSTTFKMMTCETFPTRGEIVANDQRQHVFDNAKYLNGLGYCPQFFGMDDFLTGRQNLELLLALDGLTAEDSKKEAVRWLELIDLTKYADRPVSDYSGGCSRRLSSVAALARRAALSLLDEPTAGVDVAARRQLWRAVRAAQAQTTLAGRKRAVLITSHSMDEMEALCARVGIMSEGRLAALGSPAALRAAHNAGLALFIKIRHASTGPDADVTDSPSGLSPELKRLKETCLEYQWTPKDEHRTMLNYHVDKSLKLEYSELFTKLEELRRTFPDLIEDYAVTETTLEQVFLSYAKTPQDGNV